MNRFALFFVLLCGLSTGDAYPQNEVMQKCFQEKALEIQQQVQEYQICISKRISFNQSPNGNEDPETTIRNVFKQMCSNSDGILECIRPIGKTFMSCVGDSNEFLQGYEKGLKLSFDYLCKDEGRELSGLLADPEQMKCLSNLPSIIQNDECDFRSVAKSVTEEKACTNVKEKVECIADRLRQTCYKHGLVNYIENYFYSIMESACGTEGSSGHNSGSNRGNSGSADSQHQGENSGSTPSSSVYPLTSKKFLPNETMQKCFEEKGNELGKRDDEYLECMSRYISFRTPGDYEMHFRSIFEQMCRYPKEMLECIIPAGIMAITCIDNSPNFLQGSKRIFKLSFDYFCEDNGVVLAGLMGGMEHPDCASDLTEILITDKCKLTSLLTIPLTDEHACNKIDEKINCLAEGLRKRCGYSFLKYLENYMYAIIKPVCKYKSGYSKSKSSYKGRGSSIILMLENIIVGLIK